MSFLKKIFAKKDQLPKSSEKVYALSDYEDTYKDIIAVFKLVGLRMTRKDSPSARYWWDVFYWFEFVAILMGLVLEVVEAVITGKGGSFDDMVAIFRMLPCISYLILANLKTYKMICNRPIFENLTNELRMMWPDGAVSDDEHRVLNNALKELKYIVKAYCWCNYFLILSYLVPCYVDIVRRAFGQDVLRILPFFFWFPFDPLQPGIFEVLLVLQSWQTTLTVWFMLCADILFCIYLSHITTQLDLLSLRILRLVYVPVDNQLISDYPLGSNVVGSRDEQEQLNMITWESKHHKELVSILKRHTDLIRLSNDVEEMFSFGWFINFLMTSLIICFCGFCCVLVEKWNETTYKVFLITGLSQTWLICWHGQKLLDSSTGIADALYSSGWYMASKKVRSTMFIMMQRSSKDIHVTTYGFSTICLASFATIIKTAWSYFTLLLNTYQQ